MHNKKIPKGTKLQLKRLKLVLKNNKNYSDFDHVFYFIEPTKELKIIWLNTIGSKLQVFLKMITNEMKFPCERLFLALNKITQPEDFDGFTRIPIKTKHLKLEQSSFLSLNRDTQQSLYLERYAPPGMEEITLDIRLLENLDHIYLPYTFKRLIVNKKKGTNWDFKDYGFKIR